MTNSSHTVDFNLNHNISLPSNVVPVEKCKFVNKARISQGVECLTYQTHNSASLDRFGYNPDADDKVKCVFKSSDSKTYVAQVDALLPNRVHVQHMQTHITLPSNHWSRRTFHNLSDEIEKSVSDINRNSNNNNILSKECAFSLSNKFSYIDENPKDNFNCARLIKCNNLEKGRVNRSIREMDAVEYSSDRRVSPLYRTEYQENAFLHIEDVHNYAKVNRYSSYSNETSNSSLQEDDNDNDNDNEDEDEVDELNDIDGNVDNATTNYECYFKNRKKSSTRNPTSNFKPDGGITILEKGETEQEVDIDTVQKIEDECEVAAATASATATAITPDHHARRPMNAFLIFCKRHRAIVKDRYKSLENRAITKILGDWWASLDVNDKKCFTNLAQQNKDAFFTANPNFKWYKLPAPPLRTLNTRPSNNGRTVEQDESIRHMLVESNNCTKPNKHNHYFKLADEAQMGELSTLINGENSNNNLNNNSNNNATHNALQQALSETTHFFNSYMPLSMESNSGVTTSPKRRLYSENSHSSNGSEDDALPKKLSRSCKGKIYQELINSGQISAVTKKMKTSKLQSYSNTNAYQDLIQTSNLPPTVESITNIPLWSNSHAYKNHSKKPENTLTEGTTHAHFELINFDLEEKIKELPALSLDLYLQRKRNTKKKKKFTSKKRNSNSASSSKSSGSCTVTHTSAETSSKDVFCELPTPQAVGSQKRKARKESITRRNISAIEEEITSVIPITTSFSTINGCYYFNESPESTVLTTIKIGSQVMPKVTTPETDQHRSNVFGTYSDNTTSSTSDLLILAEVAANRTELSK